MNNKILFSALVSACLMAGGSAYAQNHDDHRDDHDNRGQYQQRDDHHDDRHDDHGDRRNDRYDYHHDEGHGGPRGAGPRHDMMRGQRIGQEYRGNQYVVDDWRGHHLRQPPRGQHWVQVGGDYVLVAVATGIIADMLLNN